jgi:hypothetical protein
MSVTMTGGGHVENNTGEKKSVLNYKMLQFYGTISRPSKLDEDIGVFLCVQLILICYGCVFVTRL